MPRYKTNMNLPKFIRELQRNNERDLLRHLRNAIAKGRPVSTTMFLGNAWRAALERLEAAGKVKYVERGMVGHYAPVRGARPVTNAK
jgi:hypothetical protein